MKKLLLLLLLPFTLFAQKEAVLHLTTDGFPNETYWYVIVGSNTNLGDTIDSVSPGHYTLANTTYSDSMTVMNSVTTTAGEGCSGYILFTSPALAIKPSCSYNIAMGANAYSDGESWSGGGKYDTATAYDGIRFISSSGNITTLQATLYGHTD